MSPAVTEHSGRLDLALTLMRQDPKRASQHRQAALRATGDLQRALILELLALERVESRVGKNNQPERK
jgi:hypothetical protein